MILNMKRLSFIITLNILSICLFAEVKKDSVFSESEVILKTSTGDIYGTLAIPNNVKTSPVVLIIAGSGPTNRDGNNTLGANTNAYKMLSVSLAKNGISSVRFDKRGIGESKQAMTSESDLRFDTYINDVVLWIELLKNDRRFSKIYILGHSEGSLIGMIAAEQTNTSGFISIAGAGKSIDKILQEQLKTKLPPLLLDESNKILDSLKSGKTVSNVNPSLVSLYRPSIQPYMISWIKYDPTKEISKLKIPVLIIQGTTDLQVTVDDARLLSQATTYGKIFIIDKMNHVMKESDSDIQKNIATYNNPNLPLKEGLADDIVNFINNTKWMKCYYYNLFNRDEKWDDVFVGTDSTGYYTVGTYSLLPFRLAKKKTIQMDEQMGMAGFICLYKLYRGYPVYCPNQKPGW